MGQYIVESDDQSSESLIVDYHIERVGTQATVARVHGAIVRGLAAEASFNALVAPGGALEALEEYHADKKGPLAHQLDMLRADMVALRDRMEAMSAAVPGLFPGVG